MDYLEKKSDESKQIYISDDKEFDKRDQKSKNYDEKVTENIKVLKLGKLSSQKI